MQIMKIVAVGLLLSVLYTDLACAQNGGNLDKGAAQSLQRGTQIAKPQPSRSRSRKRHGASKMKDSTSRSRGETSGITIKSICIGCNAR
ncbi:hypothetical protein GGR33_005246 [Methylobacterium brachythecii]|uniref:Secreted protein n=1 Tax=Methylobacterium brachythecii TaxID=1176177 RepID=A0A7W6F9R0_9HYPH|nr:hypothetical protein [Methylobacterium brachythecii]GLS47049.1 hypothetical protein GCM10007884_50500 [Methylobacterium brachythecii]